jgi:4-hydroxybenzoate polyprenyltransferase
MDQRSSPAARPLLTDEPLARSGAFDTARELVGGMRPRQWFKNLFVVVALLFTNSIPTSLADAERWRRVGLCAAALIIFCLISGAVYLMNDVADRERDRLHPEKRKRAIAGGRLSWRTALLFAILVSVGGVAASFAVNARFGFVALGYLVLQVAYTIALKHMVLIDVFAIASGFVFRTVAGAYAIGVPNSSWLLVCTLQLALFLGFGKRRHELVSLADQAGGHRRNLALYTVPLLDQLIGIVVAGLTVSYAIYTIMSPTAIRHPRLVVTLPNVMYGLFRYLYLIQVEHRGGSPESILLEDRPMQVNLALWLAEVIVAFKVGG